MKKTLVSIRHKRVEQPICITINGAQKTCRHLTVYTFEATDSEIKELIEKGFEIINKKDVSKIAAIIAKTIEEADMKHEVEEISEEVNEINKELKDEIPVGKTITNITHESPKTDESTTGIVIEHKDPKTPDAENDTTDGKKEEVVIEEKTKKHKRITRNTKAKKR